MRVGPIDFIDLAWLMMQEMRAPNRCSFESTIGGSNEHRLGAVWVGASNFIDWAWVRRGAERHYAKASKI